MTIQAGDVFAFCKFKVDIGNILEEYILALVAEYNRFAYFVNIFNVTACFDVVGSVVCSNAASRNIGNFALQRTNHHISTDIQVCHFIQVQVYANLLWRNAMYVCIF